MGERLDAESVRDLMFRYFHEMRSAIEHHGGTVEKFIGDAVVAVFGVPTAHEDDALRAVRAAAELRERLHALNDELEGNTEYAEPKLKSGQWTVDVNGGPFESGDAEVWYRVKVKGLSGPDPEWEGIVELIVS